VQPPTVDMAANMSFATAVDLLDVVVVSVDGTE
jgi:hypothetical protein